MSRSLPHKSSAPQQDRALLLEPAGPYTWKITSPKDTIKKDRGWWRVVWHFTVRPPRQPGPPQLRKLHRAMDLPVMTVWL